MTNNSMYLIEKNILKEKIKTRDFADVLESNNHSLKALLGYRK